METVVIAPGVTLKLAEKDMLATVTVPVVAQGP